MCTGLPRAVFHRHHRALQLRQDRVDDEGRAQVDDGRLVRVRASAVALHGLNSGGPLPQRGQSTLSHRDRPHALGIDLHHWQIGHHIAHRDTHAHPAPGVSVATDLQTAAGVGGIEIPIGNILHRQVGGGVEHVVRIHKRPAGGGRRVACGIGLHRTDGQAHAARASAHRETRKVGRAEHSLPKTG